MNKKRHAAKYLLSDALAAMLAWTLFYIFRKIYIEPHKFGYQVPLEFGTRYYLGLLFIPVFWLILNYILGYYKDIYRKSRLIELGQTMLITCIGVIIIFFVLILDDVMLSYKFYYRSIFALFSFHFILTYIPRLIITTHTNNLIHKGSIGFNTLVVGSREKALELLNDFDSQPESTGNVFVGFVSINGKVNGELKQRLPYLGTIEKIRQLIREKEIEEVVVAIESSEHDKIKRVLNQLKDSNVIVKVIPTMYDILTGTVKMSTIYGVPLIEISHDLMPAWQENLKRAIDVTISAFALILLMPLYIFLALGVKLTSKGPIFYTHERIGRYGKPFTIYKFRSMFVDAEKNGPALSSENDDRITSFGLFMRRTRLDELPQFYNVLVGDMSIVGPRPERQYFIDQIVKMAPHYYYLQKVRPGITSWGQVKYGYAENVEQMVERLKYDIIYIENMSLYVDFKIMIYTIRTVLKGSGK